MQTPLSSLSLLLLALALPVTELRAAGELTPSDRSPHEIFTSDKVARTNAWPEQERIRASWSVEAITRTQRLRFTPRPTI